jgi:hypothetical protein
LNILQDKIYAVAKGFIPAVLLFVIFVACGKSEKQPGTKTIGETLLIAKYFRGEEVPAVLPVPVGIMEKNSLQEAK